MTAKAMCCIPNPAGKKYGQKSPALSKSPTRGCLRIGTAAVCGLPLRLAHGFGRQTELPQRRGRHLRLYRHHELLCGLQSRHILLRNRGKSDPAVLPQAEIRGLQQAVLAEADVQGIPTQQSGNRRRSWQVMLKRSLTDGRTYFLQSRWAADRLFF